MFLLDVEGLWRFDPEWTRDCWGRVPAGTSVAVQARWGLARDRESGFVVRLLVTGEALVEEHPRLQVRWHTSRAEMDAAYAMLGRPAVAVDAW